MKQIYTLALAISLMTSGAGAAVPFIKGETPPTHPSKAAKTERQRAASALRAAEAKILVEEDFSRFTGGTEDSPGEEIEYINRYHIPDELMAQPDWTGGGIYPTSGSIALMDRKNDDRLGFISTPPLYLAGTATLTFRARTLPGHKGGSLWVALCDDYYGPGDDQEDFILTNEWTTYTMVATNGSDEEYSYFQLQAEKGYVQLDDIKIEFKRDRLPSPYANKAKNISPTEFIANWDDVGTPLYRLNVLCKAAPVDVVTGEITESFDGINVNADGKTINTAEPNYPEGWEIDLSSNGLQDVSTDEGWYNSAPLALKFDMPGDVITSPETPEPIDNITFWIRPSQNQEDDPYFYSILRVEIYHTLTESWEAIAQLPYYWMQDQGGYYQFPTEALGEDANRVRFSMIQRGSIDFFVDDITIGYRTRGITSAFIENLDVEGTEYTVSGINPDNEYTYYVQAVDDDLISGISNPVWVDGITGLRPEVLQPTGISADSFTANWNRLGHATNYKVEINSILRAEKDMPGTLVLEESFDAIDSEGYDWVSPFNFAENGMAGTGWCATQPTWRAGMAGTQGTSYFGQAGLVYSPYLNLSGNNNEGFDVETTVVTTSDNYYDEEGNAYPEGVFVIVLDSYTDNQAKAFALIETPKAGSYTASVTVPNPDGVDLSNVIVAFMSMSGASFFVDDVKITQNLRAGETLTAPYAISFTPETSEKVEGIIEGRDYEYSVTASTRKNYEDYVSLPSEKMNVPISTVSVKEIEASAQGVSISAGDGIITVTAPSEMAVEVYSSNGMVMHRANGSASIAVEAGIYVVKAGDVTRKIAVSR